MPELLHAVQEIAGRYPDRSADDLATIARLVERGAPLVEADNDGYTAFFWAVRCDLHDIAEFLERAGADTSGRSDAQLISAAFSGDGALARTALANGANPERGYFGMSVLELSTYHGNPEVVEVLVDAGACIPSNALWPLGVMDITDWMIDRLNQEEFYARVVRILLAHGARPDVSAYNGRPLISSFPEASYPKIHRVLANALSVPNKRDP